MSEINTDVITKKHLESVVTQRGISDEMKAAAQFNAKAALTSLQDAGLTSPQIDAFLGVLRNHVALYRAHLTGEATGDGLPDVLPDRTDLITIQDWGLTLRAAMRDLLPPDSAL